MEILDVVVAEMHVNMDISLTELKLLKQAMDNCTVSYNSSNESEVAYHACFFQFYEFVKGVVEGAENVTNV